MSIKITPEVLRAVAAVFDPEGHTYRELNAAADKIERAQADENRLDELAAAFFRAAHPSASPWAVQSDIITDQYRAGVQAVLAAYDPKGRLTAPQPYDNGGPAVRPLRQWGDLRDVPDDVQAVFTFEGEAHRDECALNGWRWINRESVSVYGLTAHAPYTEISEEQA